MEFLKHDKYNQLKTMLVFWPTRCLPWFAHIMRRRPSFDLSVICYSRIVCGRLRSCSSVGNSSLWKERPRYDGRQLRSPSLLGRLVGLNMPRVLLAHYF